jgi:chaperonin GroES
MELSPANLNRLIVVGDRVLVKPKSLKERTKSGLYLPATVVEKEEVQSGYIIKAGPGYPIPSNADDDDLWKKEKENIRYIPLQAKEGDMALYLQKHAIEIEFEQEKYFLVPQSAILLLLRDEE